MKKRFLVLSKDDTTENPDTYLVTDVAYFDDGRYQFYRFTSSGYQEQNSLSGVWFGLEPGQRKVDVDSATASRYEQALSQNKMNPVAYS